MLTCEKMLKLTVFNPAKQSCISLVVFLFLFFSNSVAASKIIQCNQLYLDIFSAVDGSFRERVEHKAPILAFQLEDKKIKILDIGTVFCEHDWSYSKDHSRRIHQIKKEITENKIVLECSKISKYGNFERVEISRINGHFIKQQSNFLGPLGNPTSSVRFVQVERLGVCSVKAHAF